MANRNFTQFMYTPHKAPVIIDCNIAIGATGAVGTVKGPGVTSVTRLAAGNYMVKFQDNYYKFYGADHWIQAPLSGTPVAGGAFITGTVYQIVTMGTTTQAQWVTAGVPAGITAAVGVAFKAAGAGAGTGTVNTLVSSGIASVEVIGNTSLQLAPQPAPYQGGYVIVRTLGPTAAGNTALIATDPVSGSVLGLNFYLSNSSVTLQGE